MTDRKPRRTNFEVAHQRGLSAEETTLLFSLGAIHRNATEVMETIDANLFVSIRVGDVRFLLAQLNHAIEATGAMHVLRGGRKEKK